MKGTYQRCSLLFPTTGTSRCRLFFPSGGAFTVRCTNSPAYSSTSLTSCPQFSSPPREVTLQVLLTLFTPLFSRLRHLLPKVQWSRCVEVVSGSSRYWRPNKLNYPPLGARFYTTINGVELSVFPSQISTLSILLM